MPNVPRASGFLKGLHFGDTVRAAMPVLMVAGFVRVLLFGEIYRMDGPGWLAFAIITPVLMVSAVRIFRLEALRPDAPGLVITRTRELGAVTELMIAGFGAFLLWLGLFAVILSGSTEVWGGESSTQRISAAEVAMGVTVIGLPGFFMVYWRPMFVVDLEARTIRRYPFGRALGRARSFSAKQLRIFSEGYWVTNTRHRLGDMIRGKVDNYTFELEMIAGNVAKEHVAQRVAWWAQALDAEVAADAEA